MIDGFFRVAVATPSVRVADVPYNLSQIAACCQEASEAGAGLVVLPELCLTGYTCSDLFLSQTLLEAAEGALVELASATAGLDLVIVAGLPFASGSALYNVAAVLCHGNILGLVPKVHIPNYAEFYEARHFTPGPSTGEATFAGRSVPFGTDLIFACQSMPALKIAVEICEDMWVPQPPSIRHAAAGATIIANLSASDEIIGKADYRRLLARSISGRLICGYLYADAGIGESTTDLVFAGHNLICENGRLLKESKLFEEGVQVTDLDLMQILSERRRTNTFPVAAPSQESYRTVPFDLPVHRYAQLLRDIAPRPFVPRSRQDLSKRCEEILALQMNGLKKRLAHTQAHTAVVGLSGGLDSTLALLVTARAFQALDRPLSGLIAITMPGFGTTDRTYTNALSLAESIGATLMEIPISEAVTLHFRDIGQDPGKHDVTYENAQARERTQILMDVANQRNGLVIGTGDLSELALGWATYNGDHMSMYGVNSSIPKTLVRHLVRHVAAKAKEEGDLKLHDVLSDVLKTPVSPELLPPKDGEIVQQTEQIVGPYELHDFFLYYLVRYGMRPRKILRLAEQAFEGTYDHKTILSWLRVFLRRFFAQQFKRSCLPDGPKVGSVTLSPRGDWRMPSDAQSILWLNDLSDSDPLPSSAEKHGHA